MLTKEERLKILFTDLPVSEEVKKERKEIKRWKKKILRKRLPNY